MTCAVDVGDWGQDYYRGCNAEECAAKALEAPPGSDAQDEDRPALGWFTFDGASLMRGGRATPDLPALPTHATS